jgi:hypothetical protein
VIVCDRMRKHGQTVKKKDETDESTIVGTDIGHYTAAAFRRSIIGQRRLLAVTWTTHRDCCEVNRYNWSWLILAWRRLSPGLVYSCCHSRKWILVWYNPAVYRWLLHLALLFYVCVARCGREHAVCCLSWLKCCSHTVAP